MLEPMHNRILVKRKEEERSSGGLYIPESARQGSLKATVGKVIAIGPSVVQGIEVDDTILFGRYSGAEHEYDGVNYVIMNDDDVLCKVNKQNA